MACAERSRKELLLHFSAIPRLRANIVAVAVAVGCGAVERPAPPRPRAKISGQKRDDGINAWYTMFENRDATSLLLGICCIMNTITSRSAGSTVYDEP